jgi:wyosine [tRNA(Phe)-imidazoG37] synthetase (radical SAM superfamily)/biotin operon repressor
VAKEKKYFYGPVPSRRLGLSYGVDIVPFKVCTLDCVYCQLGTSTEKTVERKDYVSPDAVLAELRETLAEGLEADFITISGSGEPTLNSRLGEFIDGVKEITNIPVALLTNSTLLYRQDVRADCAKADVVLPSLDAGDEQAFEEVNRPHKDISIENLISGLCIFRNEFPGQIWLEVFLIDGLNTDAGQIVKIKNIIERIRPDKIQLNTAVRPTTYAGIKRVDAKQLEAIAAELGKKCEVVADFSSSRGGSSPVRCQPVPTHQDSCWIKGQAEDLLQPHFTESHKMGALLSMLKRRPCSLGDICSGLGIGRNEALKHISGLQRRGVINSEEKDGRIFFKALS